MLKQRDDVIRRCCVSLAENDVTVNNEAAPPPSPLHQLKLLTGIYLVTAILFQREIISSPLNDNSLATSVYNRRHMNFDRLLEDLNIQCCAKFSEKKSCGVKVLSNGV